jgi:hypothetical protein
VDIVENSLVSVRLSMPIKYMNNFVTGSVWLGRVSVLGLLVGFLAACNNEEANNPDVVVVSPSPTIAASPSPNVVVVSPSPTVAASPAAAEPITDVVVIATAPNKQSFVNRQVEFTNVPVQSVVGDRTFWVGSGNNERLFVVLDEALDNGRTEKNLKVNEGQTLMIRGLIRSLPSTQEAQKQWGLSAAEAEALRNQQVYLQASQVQMQ